MDWGRKKTFVEAPGRGDEGAGIMIERMWFVMRENSSPFGKIGKKERKQNCKGKKEKTC